MPQRGGSRRFIQDLVPGVRSPDTMDAQMEFFLVSGHGVTETRRLMVVPDYTFVMFLGESAFIRSVVSDLEKIGKLISPMGYMEDGPKAKGVAVEERNTELFKSFITGESKLLKFYPGASIYCPGDILPDTHVSFLSGKQAVWSKGVFSLPVTDKEYETLSKIPNNLYELAQSVKDGLAPNDLLSKLKNEKREEFMQMTTMRNYKEWQDTFGRRGSNELSDYFNDVDTIWDFFDTYTYFFREANLAKMLGVPITGEFLSELVSKVVGDGKPYRFFIFTGCRGPILPPGQDDFQYGYELSGRAPANFPANMSGLPLRKFQRRASLSSKCATDSGKPAMNLVEVRNKFFTVAHSQKFKKIIDDPENAAAASLFQFLKDYFFIGPRYMYPTYIPTTLFAILLTYAFMEGLPALPELDALIEAIRESFGEFARLLRREAPFPTNGLTLEQVLLRYIGLEGLVTPGITKFVNMGKAIRGEEAHHRSKYARKVAAFRAAIDDMLRRVEMAFGVYSETYQTFMKSVREEIMGKVGIQNIHKTKEELEKGYIRFLDEGAKIRDALKTERAKLSLQYNFLELDEQSYRSDDFAKLVKEINGIPELLRPLRELVDMASRAAAVAAAVAPPAVAARGGRRRTRRLRKRRV